MGGWMYWASQAALRDAARQRMQRFAVTDPGALRTYVAPYSPRLKFYATLLILAGVAFTAATLPDGDELATYRYAAFALFVPLVLAVGVEAFAGLRSLVRVDIAVILTLYFLTFAEFLHPNVRVLHREATGGAILACHLVLTGIACLVIGRHLSLPWRQSGPDGKERPRVSLPEVSPETLLIVFFLFTFLGFFYVLLTTYFNPFEIFEQLMRPRFMRPWQRSQEGGWVSFLTELQLLLYIVAALGGFIFANASRFHFMARIAVTMILLAMLFFDFAEGARNVVLIKSGLFLVAYFVSMQKPVNLRVLVLSLLGASALWVASGYMLDFRNQGLRQYLAEGPNEFETRTFMIDNNMVSIARVVEVFPSAYPYPGTEVIIQTVTKWIPRALWPDKPSEWSTSIEAALNTGGGYTLAVTFVGEAYLIAGFPTLILVSLLLGAAAAAWTRVGLAARSNLDLIYYASGFFAAALAMRSIQFVSIAMVPTIGFYLFSRYLVRRKPQQRGYAL